jgi:hypothetical protein
VERTYTTCPHASLWRPTCKRRSCVVCGLRWARNWYVVLSRAFDLFDGVVMVTLTAPGADELPWDRDRCKHGPGVACSGKRGCRVDGKALKEWADYAGWRWSGLRDVARKATQARGHEPVLLARVWEPQKRGVPHLHLVLAAGRPCDRIAAYAFADALREHATRFGFGEQLHVGKPQSGPTAARYIGSYLTGRNAHKPTVRENIADPNLPKSLLWVKPELTALTGVSMRTLRIIRWIRAWERGRVEAPPRCPDPVLFWRACVGFDLVYRT